MEYSSHIRTSVVLLLALAAVAASTANAAHYQNLEDKSRNTSCFPKTWNVLKEKGIILAEPKTACSPLGILRCYCLSPPATPDPELTIGQCSYACFYRNTYKQHKEYYKVEILNNSSMRNGTCEKYNREGVLCGKCKEGYGPPVYSFSIKCVPCTNISLWATLPLYVLTAYGPLTVFLVVIVFFTVSVNSAPLRGWILVCQLLSSDIPMRLLTAVADVRPDYAISPPLKTLGSVYGVWNLDFFRSVYRPFCLHPSLTTLQVMTLDYVIAAYPLVLIIGTYVLVDMYSREVSSVVVVGRLFQRCCIRFRHKLNIRTSLIDAFGTFFSLSYVKFLSTSVNLLMSTTVWSTDNTTSRRVYFDGSMEFFRGEHIPFAITAVTLGLLCNILPIVVILLYSFPRTHSVIGILPVSVRTAMFPFMDNILACYKDGTKGTRNCRYFAVVYHFALFSYICSYAWTKTTFSLGLNTFACIVVGMLVAVIQPYKSKVYNTVDIILILGVGLCYAGAMSVFIAYMEDPAEQIPAIVISVIPSTIPFLYFVGYSMYNCCRLFAAVYHWVRPRGKSGLNVAASELEEQPLLT